MLEVETQKASGPGKGQPEHSSLLATRLEPSMLWSPDAPLRWDRSGQEVAFGLSFSSSRIDHRALTPNSPSRFLLHSDSGLGTQLPPDSLGSHRCGSALSLPQSQTRTPGQTPWRPSLLPTLARANGACQCLSSHRGFYTMCICIAFIQLLGGLDRKCFCPVLLCIKDHTSVSLSSKVEVTLGTLTS